MLNYVCFALAALAFLFAAAAARAEPAALPNPAGATPIEGTDVFEAFHGYDGIERIMDDFVPRITADPRIRDRFLGADLERLRYMLTQQVCFLTGGPCTYAGRDMSTVHKGLGLRNADFNALAEDLQIAMDRENVPYSAQNKLLAKLAPMQRVIVEK